MSFELDCIKQRVVGGPISKLPSDVNFLSKTGFTNVLDYLEKIWDRPEHCYFVWCNDAQLEEIRAIDHPELALEVLKADVLNNERLYLLRVCARTFYQLRVQKSRLYLNGETGFRVTTIGKTIELW